MSQPNWSYKEALMKLPRSTRSMYIHAYQSLLWNKVSIIFANKRFMIFNLNNFFIYFSNILLQFSKRFLPTRKTI